jgi:hypothetical protein
MGAAGPGAAATAGARAATPLANSQVADLDESGSLILQDWAGGPDGTSEAPSGGWEDEANDRGAAAPQH